MNALTRPLDALRRRVTRMTARRPFEIDLDHAIITFTFDDFPKSAVDIGAAGLEARGWRGTYFAAAHVAGGMTHHGAMFDAGDLQRLSTEGHEIGCHTYGHLDCVDHGVEAVLSDVRRNARALSAMGHEEELTSFAYPYGEATPRAKRALSNWFEAQRGVQAGVNRGVGDLNLLKAVGLDGGEAGRNRAVEAAESLVEAPGWLIFYGHDIQDDPGRWGCTEEHYEAVLQAAERSGAKVLTMRDALAAIRAGETAPVQAAPGEEAPA
jgi:peptidoglycan/xylan/chitin deacetylase (PgdA/CDA1 family)